MPLKKSVLAYYTLKHAGLFQAMFGSNMDKTIQIILDLRLI